MEVVRNFIADEDAANWKILKFAQDIKKEMETLSDEDYERMKRDGTTNDNISQAPQDPYYDVIAQLAIVNNLKGKR